MVRSIILGIVVLTAMSACLIFTTTASAEPLSVDKASDDASAASTTQVIPEVKDAFSRFQNRDTSGALETLQKAIELHPEMPPANVIMAQFCMGLKQPEANIRYWLEKSTMEDSEDPEAYIMLGRIALQKNYGTEAELLFAKASQLLADFKGDAKRKEDMQLNTYGQLAQLAAKRKDWALARKNLEALLQLSPNNAAALQMLAAALFNTGKTDEAMEKLRAAAAIDTKILTPEATMAMWYEDKGDHKKATELMIEALNAKPKDFETRLKAAEWAMKTESFDQARQQAEIAIKLDPESVTAKVRAGNIALFQKDYPAAVEYYKQAIAEDPTNFTATNNIALALCEEGGEKNLDLALDYANINTKLYPKAPVPYSTLGWVLFKMGKLDEAERVLQYSANAGNGIEPDTAYYLASVYAEKGRKDEARDLLERALKTKSLFAERDAAQALLDKLNR